MAKTMKVAAVAAALCAACGGSGSGFSGTVKGVAFTPADQESGSAPLTVGSSSTAGVVFIANQTGLCAAATAGHKAKSASGYLFLLEDVNTTTGATTAPTAPGTYSISGSAAKSAFVAFDTTDASCNNISAQSATGASGTVTLTSVSNGAYAGNFDVIFDSNDHVTGSFSATNCAGLSAVFGSSTATCP